MRVLVITNKVHDNINHNFLSLLSTVNALINVNLNHETIECHVMLIGHDLSSLGLQIARYPMINKVLLLDDVVFENVLSENIAPIISEIALNYTHVLIAADSFGKNVLPRVAGMLKIGQISEVVTILSADKFKRFIYAGNILITVEALDSTKLLTIRTSSFTPTNLVISDNRATIIKLNFDGNLFEKSKFVSKTINTQIDLNNAKVVVSGGRSLGSKDAFDKYIYGLAAKLNAAVGASRAAVEAGFASNDCQVGQTGKIVAPELYIAIGLSGAVQHIAGMKDSKTVIAINNDPSAPIFEYADYGIIGDLFTIVPKIIEQL